MAQIACRILIRYLNLHQKFTLWRLRTNVYTISNSRILYPFFITVFISNLKRNVLRFIYIIDCYLKCEDYILYICEKMCYHMTYFLRLRSILHKLNFIQVYLGLVKSNLSHGILSSLVYLFKNHFICNCFVTKRKKVHKSMYLLLSFFIMMLSVRLKKKWWPKKF